MVKSNLVLNEIHDLIVRGKSLKEIDDAYPDAFMRYSRRIIHMFSTVVEPPMRDDISIEVFVGPTRSGKSRKAYELYPDAFWVYHTHNMFGRYRGEKVVIMDNFNGKINYKTIATLLDRYPLQVKTDGGSFPLMATRFVLITNKKIEDLYPKQEGFMMRIREFGKVINFDYDTIL